MKNLGLAPRTRGRPVKTQMLKMLAIMFPIKDPDHAYRWQYCGSSGFMNGSDVEMLNAQQNECCRVVEEERGFCSS